MGTRSRIWLLVGDLITGRTGGTEGMQPGVGTAQITRTRRKLHRGLGGVEEVNDRLQTVVNATKRGYEGETDEPKQKNQIGGGATGSAWEGGNKGVSKPYQRKVTLEPPRSNCP